MIIPFGIELNKRTDITPVINNKLRIGTAGRLVGQKRIHLLFDALEYYNGQNELEIHIAGDGPEREHLEHLSQMTSEKVTTYFKGYVNDMTAFYKSIDVFILPSVGESYGLVVLEAMANNTPCIVFTDTGACIEFIEQNRTGFIVNNINELSDLFNQNKVSYKVNEMKLNLSHMHLEDYDIRNTSKKIASLKQD